jgi:hypothetical protein
VTAIVFVRLRQGPLASSCRSPLAELVRWQPTAQEVGVAAEGEKVSAEMAQTGTRMHWEVSGPGKNPTDFWTWASASSEGPLPTIAATTTMNCWEVILLLAYRRGAVSWKWIHDVYVSTSDPKNWNENLVEKMSSGLQIPNGPSDNPPRIPIRGDIVFFDGAAHVALATGTHDGMGRTQVLSFWPPRHRQLQLRNPGQGEADDYRRTRGVHVRRD